MENNYLKKLTVVLSGGQDSTTVAVMMRRVHHRAEIDAITFNYGQRHISEISAAQKIAEKLGMEHTVIDVVGLGKATSKVSALTDSTKPLTVDGGFKNLPTSFVPCRNIIFLTLAAAHAISRGGRAIATGVSQADYSGYPDCREPTIRALQKTINFGNGLEEDSDDGFKIIAPLLNMSKKDEVIYMMNAGPLAWEVLGMTVTCYEGKISGCGACPACVLRQKGFDDAGFIDPAKEVRRV